MGPAHSSDRLELSDEFNQTRHWRADAELIAKLSVKHKFEWIIRLSTRFGRKVKRRRFVCPSLPEPVALLEGNFDGKSDEQHDFNLKLTQTQQLFPEFKFEAKRTAQHDVEFFVN